MKIRLISDLHIDVNEGYDVKLDDNDVYTLIAGDICGTVDDTIKWLGSNVRRGAFCAGNHIVYDPEAPHAEVKTPIEDLKAKLHKKFPLDGDITFFDEEVGVIQKEICPNVLLVADVMYTDYKLRIKDINPKGDVQKNMQMAEPKWGHSYLNDFVFGYTRQEMYKKESWDDGTSRYGTPKGIWHLRPKYYLDHHIRAWKKVVEIVESNPDKSIILMTHHCLSKKCISSDYTNDTLNASYVSNKEAWIRKHPNIKLILSGHVHHRAHFNVGSTLYVLNPLGYCRDTMTQLNEKTGEYEMWTPNCFVDTDTWELTYEPYSNKKWEELHSAYIDKMAQLAGFFI